MAAISSARIPSARVEVGILAGYEMNHMPNHMNIVFMGKTDASKFRLDCEIMIQ